MGKYHDKFNFFYNSRAWKLLRAKKFRNENGLCEQCRAKGIANAGKEVHHVVPIEVDWGRRLDIDNLILLCRDCHDEKHGRESALQTFNRLWEEMKNAGKNADGGAGEELKPKQ